MIAIIRHVMVFTILNAVFLLAAAIERGMGVHATWLEPPACFALSAISSLILMLMWGWVVRGVNWELDRSDRDNQFRIENELMAGEIRGLREMGFSYEDAKRIASLKRHAYYHDGLSRAEREELAELAKKIRPAPSPQQDQQTQADWLRRAAE